MPKISVLSPTYNHAKYVSEAIQSVLSQTFTDFELIISDNASTDDTVAKIKGFNDPRIKLIQNDINSGISANLMRCFNKATGDYIVWLPTDDVFETNALEVLNHSLDTNPKHLAFFAQCSCIDENGQVSDREWNSEGVGLNSPQLLKTIFYQRHVFCAPTLVARRETLTKYGFFAENLRQTQDMACWIKLLFAGEVSILPDRLLRFRWRDNNLNASAISLENNRRFSFEMAEVLELFAEHITTFELLSKIFPEVLAKKDWVADDRLVHFYLAKLALKVEHYPCYWLFALRLLHRQLSSLELAKLLQEKLNFGYEDFFKLTGKTPAVYDYVELGILAEEKTKLANQNKKLLHRNNELEFDLKKLQSAITEMNTQQERLSSLSAELQRTCHSYATSLSWRLTAPLRRLKSLF